MAWEYELGRAMRSENRRGAVAETDYRVRTQEAAMILGAPDIDPRGVNLPSFNEISEAQAVSRFPRMGSKFLFGPFAHGLLGDEWRSSLMAPTHAMEAEAAIDLSFFRNITGQLAVTWTQKAYMEPTFIGDQLFETLEEPEPWNLGPHIVPKISSVQQGPQQVQPGMQYSQAQLIQDWITYPAMGKFGETLAITLEAMGADRTGQIGESFEKLGYRARYDLEAQELATATGITVQIGNYIFNGNSFNWLGAAFNSYLPSGANWINQISGVAVQGNNYAIYANLENLMGQITDPYSGIVVGVDLREMKLLVPFVSRYEHGNIINAGGVWTGPWATSAPNVVSTAPNPLDQKYEVLPSNVLQQLLLNSGLNASQVYNRFWLGNFKMALKYRQYLPWQVIAAPPMNQFELQQDIVMWLKARRGGWPSWHDPRYTFMSFNT